MGWPSVGLWQSGLFPQGPGERGWPFTQGLGLGDPQHSAGLTSPVLRMRKLSLESGKGLEPSHQMTPGQPAPFFLPQALRTPGW